MTKLNIHILMHVPFEGPGCIEDWIYAKGHTTSYTKLYEQATFPEIQSIDWLIVMGGPMGVYDEAHYNWLHAEKDYIKECIKNEKVVLGICLGSQLIAEVLGGQVYPNTQKEIGWYPVSVNSQNSGEAIVHGFESEFTVFHWHGDTFDLPEHSKRLFSSDVTPNQGFLYKQKTVGLQFHFEVTQSSLDSMIAHGMDELKPDTTVMTAEQIRANTAHIKANNTCMYRILDYLAAL